MPRAALRLLFALAFVLAPGIAFAHPGHGETGSFLAGFLHPLSGIDHLLAMTAVGLFAAHLGGRALWAVPSSFVAVMALGGIFGIAGMSLPFAESAIALSVLVFGVAIFSRMTPPVLAAMALVGAFAFFHGYAHGTEMPDGGSALHYGIGFVVATALLHGAGLTLGLSMRRFDEAQRRFAMQACGAAIGIIGAGLVIGLV